jgi:glycosyltransferase involved in cell wall biosynthesis
MAYLWHYLDIVENQKSLKILISTGIYPPAIGGPAEYAKNLKESLEKAGFYVDVRTYRLEKILPTGLRHLYYFLKIILGVLRSDYIIGLDTFSVGLPTVLAAWIFNKKIVIRTGGDFLWESYVERTGKEVLLKDFYASSIKSFNLKEKIIFRLTRWTLKHANAIVWSTLWQKDIFEKPYDLESQKHFIIENYYSPKKESAKPAQKIFVASTRKLKWKNHTRLASAFASAQKTFPEITLDTLAVDHRSFLEKIKESYAVILVSLGDISPNMILETISFNKPFILTKETGLYEKLKDVALFADPLDVKDIEQKIIYLSDPINYDNQIAKIKNFDFIHTYDDIAAEFLNIYHEI